MKTMYSLLDQIRARSEGYGDSMQPPAKPDEIDGMVRRSADQLRYDVERRYIEFLRLHNGLDWNGFSVYATSIVPIVGYEDRYINGFVEANVQYLEK